MSGSRLQTVVAGEASESDDEDEQLFIGGSKDSQMRQAAEALKHLSIVSGEASESDEELYHGEQPVKALRVDEAAKGDAFDSEQYPQLKQSKPKPDKAQPKYDSLLHWKLTEKNAALHKSLTETVGQVYLSSAREIKNMMQQLMKSQAAIQEVSNNTRIVTNDLFNLEDKIDIVSSCSLLPIITFDDHHSRHETTSPQARNQDLINPLA